MQIIESTCESLVHNLLHDTLTLLERHLSPLTVCEKIHFCTNQEKLNKKVNNREICNYIVFLSDKLLKTYENENNIRNNLYNACNLLPKHILKNVKILYLVNNYIH